MGLVRGLPLEDEIQSFEIMNQHLRNFFGDENRHYKNYGI